MDEMQTDYHSFVMGYFCAVAALLKHEGHVTPQVRLLFMSSGDPKHAHPVDRRLFETHGLMAKTEGGDE